MTPHSRHLDLALQGKAGEIFPQAVEGILSGWQRESLLGQDKKREVWLFGFVVSLGFN